MIGSSYLAEAMRLDQQERRLKQCLIYAAGVVSGVGLTFLGLLVGSVINL